MTHLDVKKLQMAGFYQDTDLDEPISEDVQTDVTLRTEIDAADSRSKSHADESDQRHVILEQTCYLNLPGIDPEDGLESPYVVHVEKEPVSYTHLDVYKRQAHTMEEDICALLFNLQGYLHELLRDAHEKANPLS